MANSTDVIRRVLGAVFLGTAILMLILGETLLAASLQRSRMVFIIYWMGCFAFTGLATLMAVLDMVVVRRRMREQQREFLETTLREIGEKQAALKKRDGQ